MDDIEKCDRETDRLSGSTVVFVIKNISSERFLVSKYFYWIWKMNDEHFKNTLKTSSWK